MWKIVGKQYRFTCPNCGNYDDYGSVAVDRVVATFSTKGRAERYLKASRLKTKRYGMEPFRMASLLRDYTDAWIEELVVNSDPIHNPEIDWNC